MGDQGLIHYEMRRYDADYDLCKVNEAGVLIKVLATIYDENTMHHIARDYEATIIDDTKVAVPV